MMPTMLSLIPGSSQFNLASILVDPLLDILPTSLPLISGMPPASIFGTTSLLQEPFTVVSASQKKIVDAIEDVECIVGAMNYQPPNFIRPPKLCHVCETGGAAPHYGGIVCGGCKIFFARAVQKKIYYVCEKNGNCKMPPGKRSKCRSCRFQLCLKAKMCPEEVGKLRDLKMPESLLIPKEEGTVVPYFDSPVLKHTIGDQRVRLEQRFTMDYPLSTQVRTILRKFVNVENCCDNNSFSFPTPKNISCSLDVSLADALNNPMFVCERIPIQWEKAASYRFKSDESQVKQIYCRFVVHYLEFLQSVDDLYQIEEKNRLRLAASKVVPMLLWTVAYNSYKYESEGLLLGSFMVHGEEFTSKAINHLLDSIRRELIQKMKQLDLTDEEYILIKLITLFTMADPLSCEDTNATVRTIRFKYERFLVSFLRDAYPGWEQVKIIIRTQALLEMVRVLSVLSQIPSLMLLLFVCLDVAGLRGELSYDLHLRRYD